MEELSSDNSSGRKMNQKIEQRPGQIVRKSRTHQLQEEEGPITRTTNEDEARRIKQETSGSHDNNNRETLQGRHIKTTQELAKRG